MSHDLGLQHDVRALLTRRRVLGLLAGAGLTTVAGCWLPSSTGSGAGNTTGAGTAASLPPPGSAGSTGSTPVANCTAEIPRETGGPFPGNGSNGPNALTQSGIVRGDITSSFGAGAGTAQGVPLTINLAVLELAKGCSGYAGAAVYVWQCDREGGHSMYSPRVAGENYLRGVQAANERGIVSFTSIFPGAYAGRWPHVHFEVYPSLAAATSAGNLITTSQLALPAAACAAVYDSSGYEESVRNFRRLSLTSDTVFRDGAAQQLATVSGDVPTGLVASLSVPVRT